uniref:PHD finger protein 5A n=1 Tax=Ficedula albicollis TaxID=59894 RepID=U3KBT6_FICAL
MASRGPFDISGARGGAWPRGSWQGDTRYRESVVGCHEGLFWAGEAIGRLCEKCDGKCVICDSYVRPCTLVRICDECNYGSYQGRCVICGGPGVSDAYYCKECTIQEKDRDGCPKIVNLGSSKTDLFYERKKYGFKKRSLWSQNLSMFLSFCHF